MDVSIALNGTKKDRKYPVVFWSKHWDYVLFGIVDQ